jgi:putative spermidine/putrescine transport system substrate-binding protein
MTEHHEDLADIALARYRAGRIDRRTFLGALTALGVMPALTRQAGATTGEFVIANWGGPAADAFVKAWGPGLKAKDGLTVAVDGSGPSSGKIRAMVEGGKVSWDICDASVGAALQLGEAGMLEEIDYTKVDKTQVRPGFSYKWAICNYMFSYVLAYNAKQFGGNPPRTWKDFWNVKDFPGKRMLRGSCIGQLECALLADGVAPKDIYPIDLKRAIAKIKEIRDHTIFWKSGSQSTDLLQQHEVVMGNMWHNRANLLRVDTKGEIQWTWEGGVVAPAVWLVPRGNPAGKNAAMEFINVALQPAGQVDLFKAVGMGPSNPAAEALVPADLRPYDPGQPENYAKQIPIDEFWYGKNLAEAEPIYLDAIST